MRQIQQMQQCKSEASLLSLHRGRIAKSRNVEKLDNLLNNLAKSRNVFEQENEMILTRIEFYFIASKKYICIHPLLSISNFLATGQFFRKIKQLTHLLLKK